MDKRTSDGTSRVLSDINDSRVRLTGIGLMCAALVLFSAMDVTVKWLGSSVNLMEIMWARYLGHFLLTCLFVNPWMTPGFWRTGRPWLQLIRSLLLLAVTGLNFVALQYLQVDQTMAITFSTPFFIALFAGPMLGEWIGPRRWLAIMVGFAGVLLVIRPTGAGVHPAMIASLAGAVCYAFYNLTTRLLAATDSTVTTMFYSSLIGAVLTSLPMPWFWSAPTESIVMVNMALTGLYGLLGHLLLILAYRRAPAATLGPFIYSQIIWMILGGWMVFGHTPSGWTLAGAGIVILSGLYLLARERRERANQSLEANVGE